MSDTPERGGDRSEERAVYIISVAAELSGVHPQTLRMYERRGLLAPKRTSGNNRRYSERDIARIQMIQELTQREGISLAGVKLFIEMREQLAQMRRRTEELERELLDQIRRRRSRRRDRPAAQRSVLPVGGRRHPVIELRGDHVFLRGFRPEEVAIALERMQSIPPAELRRATPARAARAPRAFGRARTDGRSCWRSRPAAVSSATSRVAALGSRCRPASGSSASSSGTRRTADAGSAGRRSRCCPPTCSTARTRSGCRRPPTSTTSSMRRVLEVLGFDFEGDPARVHARRDRPAARLRDVRRDPRRVGIALGPLRHVSRRTTSVRRPRIPIPGA